MSETDTRSDTHKPFNIKKARKLAGDVSVTFTNVTDPNWDSRWALNAACDEIERLHAELNRWAAQYLRWTSANLELVPEAEVLRDERDRALRRLEAAERVVELARRELPDLDDLMEPIGGGNPYYHCRRCGVTNVQLNMGEHSRKHRPECDDFFGLRALIAAYAAAAAQSCSEGG